jgi:hypothetical protein
MTKPRQAVLIIHGIGEQRPMETLRSFVLGVLGPALGPDGKRRFYSKPDPNSETFELRRYRAFEGQADSDFIEFYWQHQMPVAAWRFLLSWLWPLMNRPIKSMPPRFVILWWLAWTSIVILVAAFLLALLPWAGLSVTYNFLVPSATGIAAVVLGSVGYLVRSFVGDAAIYLNPHPRTVEARNAIRTSGVELIERLQNDGRYDRIVIVGHSLGSVIGYDILSFAWHRASEEFRKKVEAGGLPQDNPVQTALKSSETLAGQMKPGSAEQWKAATRSLAAEMEKLGLHWIVTDFITLGSPLAHASLLLARGPGDLKRRIEERELPVAPPFREDGVQFAYARTGKSPAGNKQSARVPDHAALFALTAWTNLYFPCRAFFYGDLIGGLVGPAFGMGVTDRSVVTKVSGGWLAHTHYWTRYPRFSENVDSSPVRLIEALDLDRKTLNPRSNVPKKQSPDHRKKNLPTT